MYGYMYIVIYIKEIWVKSIFFCLDISFGLVSYMIISLVRILIFVVFGRLYLMFFMIEVVNSIGFYRGKYEVYVYEYIYYSI